MLLRGVIVSSVLICMRVSGQSVISTHAGLVHFSEGAISIDGREVSAISGRFPEIPEGSLLLTNEGRAEILLAPEILLWLGRNSAIRMQRNTLDDTRIELLEGAAILQSTQLAPGNAVTLIYKNSSVWVSAQSLYRMDAASSWLTVVKGQAIATNGRDRLVINEPSRLDLSSWQILTPLPKSEPDSLDQWVLERRRVIAAASLNGIRMDAGGNSTKNNPHRRPRAYPAVMMPVPRRTW